MDFMIGLIIGGIVFGGIAFYMFAKELNKLTERHAALQKASLQDYENKMMDRQEKYHARLCKNALKKENPKLFKQLKKNKK